MGFQAGAWQVTPRLGLGSGHGSGSSHTRLHSRPRCSNLVSQPMPYWDYADGPSRLVPTAPVRGRQALGRRSKIAGGHPPVKGVFDPGPIGQGQQRLHRQRQPMPGDPRRVSSSSLIPLPPQALERLEAGFDPEPERAPTRAGFLRGKVSQYDPRFLLLSVPGHQQRATAFYLRNAERGPAPDPPGTRSGNEGARRQPPAALGAEGDVFRIPDVGMPALSAYLVPQFRTGQAPVAQHNHSNLFRHRRGQCLQQFHCRVHPGTWLVGAQDAPGHGNGATPVDHADDYGGGLFSFQRLNVGSTAKASRSERHHERTHIRRGAKQRLTSSPVWQGRARSPPS